MEIQSKRNCFDSLFSLYSNFTVQALDILVLCNSTYQLKTKVFYRLFYRFCFRWKRLRSKLCYSIRDWRIDSGARARSKVLQRRTENSRRIPSSWRKIPNRFSGCLCRCTCQRTSAKRKYVQSCRFQPTRQVEHLQWSFRECKSDNFPGMFDYRNFNSTFLVELFLHLGRQRGT